jgi:hypothetical protein
MRCETVYLFKIDQYANFILALYSKEYPQGMPASSCRNYLTADIQNQSVYAITDSTPEEINRFESKTPY